MKTSELSIDFCGEWFYPSLEQPFTIGREGDLVIDENSYLHRRLIEIVHEAGIWWIGNVGNSISIGLSAGSGGYQAWLGPGLRVPIVFPELSVIFTAGPFTYDLSIHTESPSFTPVADLSVPTAGDITIGQTTLTHTQKLLIVALCEPLLRDAQVGISRIPSSAEAAARLGWPITTFNRKLDNVCDKLDRNGVPGVRGGVGNLATGRKARLVEYAVLSRLVTSADLALLDTVSQANKFTKQEG
jgi:hypothetical protein